MKLNYLLLFLAAVIWASCKPKNATLPENRLIGIWQLVCGTTIALNKDTLVQKGLEKVENTAIDRVIIEK